MDDLIRKKGDFNPFRVGKPDSRFIKIRKSPRAKSLKYKNVQKLVQDLGFLEEGDRCYIVVDGTFYFGDFLEAFVTKYNLHIRNLTLSTLSLNKNNVDSLKNLIEGNYIEEEVHLMISDFFYSHNRRTAIPYIYEELGIKGDKFQLSIASTHMKLILIEAMDGRKFVFHGSANLISSDNLEQVCLEKNTDVYDFFFDITEQLKNKYKTINKSVRNANLKDIPYFQEDNEEEDKECKFN